jgi:hypothetical protein
MEKGIGRNERIAQFILFSFFAFRSHNPIYVRGEREKNFIISSISIYI